MKQQDVTQAQQAILQSAEHIKAAFIVANRISLPSLRSVAGKASISEAEALNVLKDWNASARNAINCLRQCAGLIQKLLEVRPTIDAELKKLESVAHGKALLQDPNNAFARKAYDMLRIAEAMKHGLTIEDVKK